MRPEDSLGGLGSKTQKRQCTKILWPIIGEERCLLERKGVVSSAAEKTQTVRTGFSCLRLLVTVKRTK